MQRLWHVEQLHKIFKLCGSPSVEYWKKSKLPHATIFKPHHPYESHLQENFRSLPQSAFKLLEIFLSVEPQMRGTATSALVAEYFRSKPLACEPASFPKYPPTKEIDVRSHEDAHRRRGPKANERARVAEVTRRPLKVHGDPQESTGLSRLSSRQELELQVNNHGTDSGGDELVCSRINGESRLLVDLQPMAALNPPNQDRHMKHISQGGIPFSGPLHVNPSSGFAWVKKPQADRPFIKSHSKSSSRCNTRGAPDMPTTIRAIVTSNSESQCNRQSAQVVVDDPERNKQHMMLKKAMLKSWAELECPDSFDSSCTFLSQDFTRGDAMPSKHRLLGYQNEEERVEFSGPLLSKSQKVHELLEKHERQIRQAVRRSWLQRVAGRKHVK